MPWPLLPQFGTNVKPSFPRLPMAESITSVLHFRALPSSTPLLMCLKLHNSQHPATPLAFPQTASTTRLGWSVELCHTAVDSVIIFWIQWFRSLCEFPQLCQFRSGNKLSSHYTSSNQSSPIRSAIPTFMFKPSLKPGRIVSGRIPSFNSGSTFPGRVAHLSTRQSAMNFGWVPGCLAFHSPPSVHTLR